MIKIKYNCPESSSEMMETNSGRFCSSCQQNVYDFRDKSTEEIHQIREEDPSIKCGFFTKQQAIVDARTAVQNIFRMAFTAIFIMGFNTTMLFAQVNNTVSDSLITVTETLGDQIMLSGVVTNENGEPVKARIKYSYGDEHIAVETDEEGRFEIEISNELLGETILLRIYSDAFQTKYVTTEVLQTKCYFHQIQLAKKSRNQGVRGFLL